MDLSFPEAGSKFLSLVFWPATQNSYQHASVSALLEEY
jgi:hypothetical protein